MKTACTAIVLLAALGATTLADPQSSEVRGTLKIERGAVSINFTPEAPAASAFDPAKECDKPWDAYMAARDKCVDPLKECGRVWNNYLEASNRCRALRPKQPDGRPAKWLTRLDYRASMRSCLPKTTDQRHPC